MLKKTEFMASFGLETLPVLQPETRAPWLVPAGGLIPAAWNVSVRPFDENAFGKWENVLHQPETKKRQTIFLKDLARPEEVWHLTYQPENDEEGLLPILLPRTDDLSLSFHITIPDNLKARLVFIEKAADSCPETAPLPSEAAEKKEAAGGKLLPNVTISADLAPYASLDILYIHPLYENAEEDGAYLRAADLKHCLYYAAVADGASFKWTSVNLGDSLVERGEVHLNGTHAEGDVGGAAYIREGSEQLYQSHIYCHKRFGHCRVHNHGVVEDEGTGTFISISDIDKGASGTEAREDNRFMVLGDKAKAFADPTLLIDEYDVKASHAATIGQVDEEALFYLQSRGLSKLQASRLMTAGFLTPLFDRISRADLRQHLLRQFYGKLQLEDVLGEDEA